MTKRRRKRLIDLRIWLPVILACLWLAGPSNGYADEKNKELEESFEKRKLSEETRQALRAANSLSKNPAQMKIAYESFVGHLLHIARSEKENKLARSQAIHVLRRIHAHGACEWLAENIAYKDVFDIGSPDPLLGYPAAAALGDIGGDVALNAIQGKITKRISEFERLLIVFVVRRIDREPEVGLLRLELALRSERQFLASHRTTTMREVPPSTMEENLVKIIDLYRKTDFKDPLQWPARVAWRLKIEAKQSSDDSEDGRH